MANYNWREHWEEKDSDGDRIQWIIETPDGFAVKYDHNENIYPLDPKGLYRDGTDFWLLPAAKEKYRPWETMEEFVDCDGHKLWYRFISEEPADNGAYLLVPVTSISPEMENGPWIGFRIGEKNEDGIPSVSEFNFPALFDTAKCAKTPFGPWLPCGRKE